MNGMLTGNSKSAKETPFAQSSRHYAGQRLRDFVADRLHPVA